MSALEAIETHKLDTEKQVFSTSRTSTSCRIFPLSR